VRLVLTALRNVQVLAVKGWREGRDLEVVARVSVHLNHSYRIVVLTDLTNDSGIAY